jgi:hypothetical protein
VENLIRKRRNNNYRAIKVYKKANATFGSFGAQSVH